MAHKPQLWLPIIKGRDIYENSVKIAGPQFVSKMVHKPLAPQINNGKLWLSNLLSSPGLCYNYKTVLIIAIKREISPHCKS